MGKGPGKWLVAGACLALCSCVAATPYQRWGNRGGYLERRLGEDEYEVSFSANVWTDGAAIYDFALLRAAEIGRGLGFTHFVVLAAEDATTITVVGVDTTSTTMGEVREDGKVVTTTETESSPATITRPRLVLHVKYFDGPPAGRYVEVYEVGRTVAELAQRHELELR
jgi:hypothetical protein